MLTGPNWVEAAQEPLKLECRMSTYIMIPVNQEEYSIKTVDCDKAGSSDLIGAESACESVIFDPATKTDSNGRSYRIGVGSRTYDFSRSSKTMETFISIDRTTGDFKMTKDIKPGFLRENGPERFELLGKCAAFSPKF